MFGWLKRFLDDAEHLLPQPVRDALSWTAQAIGGILALVTGNVTGAWHDFTAVWDALRSGTADFAHELLKQLEAVIVHWLPRYAITAWWWVTHPLELARVLTLYVVHQLEERAWQIAPYLGRFLLALLVHNAARVARLTEAIVAAVL